MARWESPNFHLPSSPTSFGFLPVNDPRGGRTYFQDGATGDFLCLICVEEKTLATDFIFRIRVIWVIRGKVHSWPD
jgi:hypothetical protein